MLRYVDGHANSQYEDELRALISTLGEMRSLVMEQFALLLALLDVREKGEDNPKGQAREIDKEINALQEQLDKAVLDLLVRHSPQLVELRFTLSASKLAGQFERMGDHCKNSIKRVWRAQDKISEELHQNLVGLAAAAAPVLEALEDALLHFDDAKAIAALEADDVVDKAYKKLVIKMPKVMDDDDVENEAISDVLFIGKNLERIADHATDIIRELYYVHHGKRMEFTE